MLHEDCWAPSDRVVFVHTKVMYIVIHNCVVCTVIDSLIWIRFDMWLHNSQWLNSRFWSGFNILEKLKIISLNHVSSLISIWPWSPGNECLDFEVLFYWHNLQMRFDALQCQAISLVFWSISFLLCAISCCSNCRAMRLVCVLIILVKSSWSLSA